MPRPFSGLVLVVWPASQYVSKLFWATLASFFLVMPPSKGSLRVRSWSILRTCWSHRNRRFWIPSPTFWLFFVFLYTSFILLRMIRSVATRMTMGGMAHSCCTPDSTENQSGSCGYFWRMFHRMSLCIDSKVFLGLPLRWCIARWCPLERRYYSIYIAKKFYFHILKILILPTRLQCFCGKLVSGVLMNHVHNLILSWFK